MCVDMSGQSIGSVINQIDSSVNQLRNYPKHPTEIESISQSASLRVKLSN